MIKTVTIAMTVSAAPMTATPTTTTTDGASGSDGCDDHRCGPVPDKQKHSNNMEYIDYNDGAQRAFFWHASSRSWGDDYPEGCGNGQCIQDLDATQTLIRCKVVTHDT